MTYYDISLVNTQPSNRFSVSLSAGTVTLNCVFEWFEEIQEEYDNYIDLCSHMAETDPINGNRTYDYLQYYLSITDIETWLEEQEYLPQSLTGMTTEDQINEIQSRIDTCTRLQEYINTYNELLVWNITVDDTYILRLIPGCIYTLDDGTLIRVDCDKESIGYDDLACVTLHIGVSDE